MEERKSAVNDGPGGNPKGQEGDFFSGRRTQRSGEALIEALATQSGNLMESPSPVTADKVEIEKAAVDSDRHLIPEGVYTVAGRTVRRRWGLSKMRFARRSFTPLESRLPTRNKSSKVPA